MLNFASFDMISILRIMEVRVFSKKMYFVIISYVKRTRTKLFHIFASIDIPIANYENFINSMKLKNTFSI